MLQGGEIIIILLVALVVLGPQRLPEVARKIGRWSAELRQAARELRRGLEKEVAELRELKQDLQQPLDELRRGLDEVTRDVDEVAGEVRRLKWVGPEPKSGPTPADALADLDEIEGKRPDDSAAEDAAQSGGDDEA